MPATYTCYVNWDNSTDLTDSTGKNISERVLAIPGYRFRRGRDQIRQISPPMVGDFDATLDNVSREYSPENSTGALYGYLVPGHQMRVVGDDGSTTYSLWTGYLDDLPQRPDRNDRLVEIPGLGTLSRLKGQKISTPLYQNITTDQAIGYILDAVGWSSDDRTLDTGKTTLLWWWADVEDALDAVRAVLFSEGPGAALYEAGDGKIVFESRHYRLTQTRCNASQATFTDSTGEPIISPPISYEPGLKSVINICEIETERRTTASSLTTVWEYGDTVTLGPSESRDVMARPSDPFQDAVAPTSSNGDYSVTAGSLSTAILNRTSGQSCTVTVTAGVAGATVTGLRLRAYTLTKAATTVLTNSVSSTASQAKYGQQRYQWPCRPEIDQRVALDFANYVVQNYQEPRAQIMATLIAAGSTARLAQNLNREISDRITLVETQTGVNGDCFVERLEHHIQSNGIHTTVYGLEKITGDTSYLILDTGKLDSTSSTASARLGW